MTTVKMAPVAINFIRFGNLGRLKASRRARLLSFQVKRRWKRAMIAPSNSGPRPVLIVVGKKAFQTIDSQMLVAMKRVIPDPSP